MIHTGDCLDVLPTLDAESIDAIVTDPPYGLAFMGKDWDHGLPGEHFWREMLRVAKPGAHLLAFGGTRTYHRLACAIEDAGWEVRDCLVWAYASGFPKSLNLDGEWQGWGTALKPAWEPIILARKPLRGTVARNVQEYGTGALNIDGCRIGLEPDDRALRGKSYSGQRGDRKPWTFGGQVADPPMGNTYDAPLGRWPANVILTDPIFDGDVPGVVGGEPDVSRFFLVPKAARSDREPVLGGLPLVKQNAVGPTVVTAADWDDPTQPRYERNTMRQNVHPTVKPTELMRHLVRLVTPPGGTVLDPFLGSGTTALAAEAEGFAWVGIEREPEYVAIAEARLNGTQKGMAL